MAASMFHTETEQEGIDIGSKEGKKVFCKHVDQSMKRAQLWQNLAKQGWGDEPPLHEGERPVILKGCPLCKEEFKGDKKEQKKSKFGWK